MILNISNRNLTVIREGTFYFELSDYPQIKDYEWNNIIAFISYEKLHGRKTEVVCEDENVLALIDETAKHLDGTEYIPPIVDGDKFVYHATDISAAQKNIVGRQTALCGKSLSKDGGRAFRQKET